LKKFNEAYDLPSAALPSFWRQVAEELRFWGGNDGPARALERTADQLEASLRREGDAPLSCSQAAQQSGYSEEHIRRMLRQQPELNCGRRGKPAIRRRDLPLKAGRLADKAPRSYDATADARSLMSRQGEQ
jgi:hypothetical protein